jgi:hypothetical protein
MSWRTAIVGLALGVLCVVAFNARQLGITAEIDADEMKWGAIAAATIICIGIAMRELRKR